MNISSHSSWLVILIGVLSTTQNHLAKALERQGIGALKLIQERLSGAVSPEHKTSRTSWIYGLGLFLNHTTFIYHLMVAPLGGTTALYTSMYGMGLVALLVYARIVLHERTSPTELGGALMIATGTLLVGLEGILRPPQDMGKINLISASWALVGIGGIGIFLITVGLRSGSSNWIGLAFGAAAGMCGALDPFLKGIAQTAGGIGVLPHGFGGWVFLAFSFLLGETAVLITQWGYLRGARASLLVPALDCTYVSLPVALQTLLLPGYVLTLPLLTGMGLILGGMVLMRAHQN